MNRFNLLAGVLATAVSAGAFAQATTTDKPRAIGVTQEAAEKANRKAVENGDVATVVRTGPNAAEKASATADKVTDKTKKTVDKTADKARNMDSKPNANQ